MWPGGNRIRVCTGVQLDAELAASLDRHRMSVWSRGTAYENAKTVCLELVADVLDVTGDAFLDRTSLLILAEEWFGKFMERS